MQTAPVRTHLDQFRKILTSPHLISTSRGRRQLEHERSSDPLTQWSRLDADRDALGGTNSFVSIIHWLNECPIHSA
jgi:hypothetical protein